MWSCASLSSCSVVMPGLTCAVSMSSTSEARRPAMRMPARSSAVLSVIAMGRIIPPAPVRHRDAECPCGAVWCHTARSMSAPGIPPVTAPRGFRVERGEGALPGSLHANPRLAQWLAFDQPGVVSVFTGKAELGQGILTALQLLVAEELDVPLAAVRVHSASTARGPDEGMTSGSLSIQDSGGALRQACAEVRALAIRAAAQRSGVPPERIAVRDGRLHDEHGHDLGDYRSLLEGID